MNQHKYGLSDARSECYWPKRHKIVGPLLWHLRMIVRAMSTPPSKPPPNTITLGAFNETHPGLPTHSAKTICASAAVTLKRHHAPPRLLCIDVDGKIHEFSLIWNEPAKDDLAFNNNRQDATRDGAYAVAIACIERLLSLVAIGRAEDNSGADWYVAPIGSECIDDGFTDLDVPGIRRLEVGGFNDRASLNHELTRKIDQLKRGKSKTTGIATVVDFKICKVLVKTEVLAGENDNERV